MFVCLTCAIPEGYQGGYISHACGPVDAPKLRKKPTGGRPEECRIYDESGEAQGDALVSPGGRDSSRGRGERGNRGILPESRVSDLSLTTTRSTMLRLYRKSHDTRHEIVVIVRPSFVQA
jgi:hypothetical protein